VRPLAKRAEGKGHTARCFELRSKRGRGRVTSVASRVEVVRRRAEPHRPSTTKWTALYQI
jgi:hypothetical protein